MTMAGLVTNFNGARFFLQPPHRNSSLCTASTPSPPDWTLNDGFNSYYKNTLSICAGAFLGMFYLWPMMALQVGLGKPSFWFFKLGAYVVLGVSMVILGSIPGLDLEIG